MDESHVESNNTPIDQGSLRTENGFASVHLRLRRPSRIVSIIGMVFLLIIGAGLWVTVARFEANRDTRSAASGSDVKLTLLAAPSTARVGDTVTVLVSINPTVSNYNIAASSVWLTYPTNTLILKQVKPGNFFLKNFNAQSREMLCVVYATEGAAIVSESSQCTRESDGATAGIVQLSLGAPCTKTEPWKCFTNNTVDTLASYTFEVASGAPAGDAKIEFLLSRPDQSSDPKNQKPQIAATNFADNTQPVNVVDFNALSSVSIAIQGNGGPTIVPSRSPLGAEPSATPRPTRTPTPTGTPIPTPTATSPPESGKVNVTLKLKLEGITDARVYPALSVKLKQNGQDTYTFSNMASTADTTGIFTVVLPNIPMGTYDVFVKPRRHLTKKFEGLDVKMEDSVIILSQTLILAGDVDATGDDRINALDTAQIIKDYHPGTPAGSSADLNLDGKVNALDIKYIITNYQKRGDQ